MLKQDQEYIGWKNEIAEELKRIRNILNQDDSFELEMARVRLKKREGKRNEWDSKRVYLFFRKQKESHRITKFFYSTVAI